MIDLCGAKILSNNIIHKKHFKADLSGVERITLLYKISAGTADFRHGDEIIEIEIINVSFKNGAVNKHDLSVIQKSIPYPILFTAHGKSYFTVEGELFESDKQFLDGDTLNIQKRSAKLTDLYDDIAATFIPIARRDTESIANFVSRYKRLQALEREIAALQRKVDSEKQPNKRIELNEELKKLIIMKVGLED